MGAANSDPSATDVDYRHTPPIVIMSFNRPQYLAETLESIRAQTPLLDNRRIHLFQDGAVNAYSGIKYGSMDEISRCIAIFCKMFPGGQLHYAKYNIGVCENYLRAERFVFESLQAPIAYFFEDDLVLSPKYLATLNILQSSFRLEPRIGCFNAVGEHLATFADQETNRHKLTTMRHRWGFAMKKSHWIEIHSLLKPYYRMVCGHDYRQRPHQEIRSWHSTWIEADHPTSQDFAKDLVALSLGCWQASTYFCLARYIGEVGTHSTPAHFAEHRYADARIFRGNIPAAFDISPQQIDSEIAKKRLHFQLRDEI